MVRSDVEGIIRSFSTKYKEITEALEKAGALNLTYGNEGIGKVTDAFKEAFQTTSVSKWDRFAAGRLVKKHDVGDLVQLIHVMAQEQGKPYCPGIGSVRDIESKWVQIANYIKRNTSQEMNF